MKSFFASIALILVFCCAKTFANNPDSLKKALTRQRDVARLPTLVRLCESDFKGVISEEEARAYAQEIFQWAKRVGDTAAQIKGCLCIAINQDNTLPTQDRQVWLSKAQQLAKSRLDLMPDVLYRWANYYAESGREDSAYLYINEAIRLTEKLHLRSKQSFMLASAARIYSSNGKTTIADSLCRLAFYYCQDANDSLAVFSRWGGIQKDFGHPEEAAKAFLKAHQLSLRLGNYVMAAFSLNQYASILRDDGQYEQAVAYFEEVIRLSQRAQYASTLAGAYNSLGVLYQRGKDYTKALHYYRLALTLKKEIGRPKKILNTIQNMVALYALLGQNDSCLALCRQYLPLSKTIKYAQIETQLSFFAAMAAAKMGRSAEARQYLAVGEKMLKEVKIVEELPEIYQNAAQTYAKLGIFEKAFQYQILFQGARDSVSNLEKSRTITEMETRFETQKKEQQIAVLAKDNQLKRTQQTALFGGLALLSLLAVLLWRNTRVRMRQNEVLSQTNDALNRKNNEVQTLLREIHHRVKNNLQIISSLLRLQARRVHDKNALEALRTGQARVRSMALLHQRLYQGEQLKDIPMPAYLSELSESLLDAYGLDEDRIRFQTDFDDIALDVDVAVPFGLIANELITNSLKYAFPNEREGVIRLVFKRHTEGVCLEVSDNGIGVNLSNGKPVVNSTSFGLELVESLAQKLNGHLVFSNGQGTKTELIVPFVHIEKVKKQSEKETV